MKTFPRQGEGLDAFVDASDTGYTVNGKPVEDGAADTLVKNSVKNSVSHASGPEGVDGLQSGGKGMNNGYTNGSSSNGYANGVNGIANGVKKAINGLETRVAEMVTVDGNGKA